MSPRAKTANSVRVMTWNVLADGLSGDDFLLNDVLEGEEDKLDVGAQIAALAAVRTSNSGLDDVKAKYTTERGQKNREAVLDWSVRWPAIKASISKMAPEIIVLHGMAPGSVLTSMLKRVDVAAYETFMDVKNGNFSAGELTQSIFL